MSWTQAHPKNVLWHCSTNIELRSLVLQFPAHQLMTRLMTSINQSVRTRELFRLWLQVGTDNSGAHWERKWREQTTVRPRYIGHVGYIGCARYVMIKVQHDSILPDQGTHMYRTIKVHRLRRLRGLFVLWYNKGRARGPHMVKVQCVKRVKCKCFVAHIQRNGKRIE